MLENTFENVIANAFIEELNRFSSKCGDYQAVNEKMIALSKQLQETLPEEGKKLLEQHEEVEAEEFYMVGLYFFKAGFKVAYKLFCEN